MATEQLTMHHFFLTRERQAARRDRSPYQGLWQQFYTHTGCFSYQLSHAVKRGFDLTLALLCILMFLPLLIMVALAVTVSSPGPLLYKSLRVGRYGRPFYMLKFRTMVNDADQLRTQLRQSVKQHNELFKMKNDPRITPIGGFLRKYSLDELPQLFNVLFGEMSLVGPRPFAPDDARLFQEPYTMRFEAVPGMTGLWQVSGRSDLSFQALCELDLSYTLKWSLLHDLQILLRTVPVVLGKSGAF